MVINRLLCGGAIAVRASRWCWAREQTFHNRPARGLVGSCSSTLNIRKDFAHSAAMSVEVSKELAGRTAVDNHVSGDTRFANQQSLKSLIDLIDRSYLSEWWALEAEAQLSTLSNGSPRELKRRICT